MPVYKTITVSKSVFVHIWKIEESENELKEAIALNEHSLERLQRMKSEMHRKGFLSIRHLLKHCGYTDFDLEYSPSGKPFLKDGKHISITHSNHFTAIIISNSVEVGIDIEKQREKIMRIAHKFTPTEAYKTVANADALIRKLTIVWGCKEALYKIYNEEGLSFIDHIYIDDFNLDQTKTTGAIMYQGKTTNYNMRFFEFEGFTCVYGLAATS